MKVLLKYQTKSVDVISRSVSFEFRFQDYLTDESMIYEQKSLGKFLYNSELSLRVRLYISHKMQYCVTHLG